VVYLLRSIRDTSEALLNLLIIWVHFGAYSRQAPPSPLADLSHLRLLTHYTQPSHALTDFSDAFRRARKYRVVIAIVMVIIMIFHAEPLCGFFAPYIDAAVL
jgi:hypothetical protein